jgi:putative proteasome-type protease
MTYCLGIKIDQAIVMMSDSRTNASMDNISTYSKMWRYNFQNERQFTICMSGNLATSQAVIRQIETDISTQQIPNLSTVTSLFEAAEYLGKTSVKIQQAVSETQTSLFEATFLLAGEIQGSKSGLFMIYPEGNFISPSTKHPFLQIGEIKYGKPILDRVIQSNTPLDRAILCSLVSMDATLKSNLSVGPPLEMSVLKEGEFGVDHYFFFDEDDEYLRQLRLSWNKLMQDSFDRLTPFPWPIS